MALSERDPAEKVMRESLSIAARVKAAGADPKTAASILTPRTTYRTCLRARQDSQDELIIAEAELSVAEGNTDDAMVSTGRRIAGRLVEPGKPGEKHPQFKGFFGGVAPSAALPDGRADRTAAVAAFLDRLKPEASPAELVKDGRDLAKAIAVELQKLAAKEKAEQDYVRKQAAEAAAKEALCIAVRAAAGAIQSTNAANPALVRRLLGKATPGARARKGGAKKDNGAPAEGGGAPA